MHWHNSAEWASVDLWYFPKGHSHAIQTLGDASLAFDDGLYAEHGTFGLSNFMSRYDSRTLALAFGGASDFYDRLPKAETYIEHGQILALTVRRRARPASWIFSGPTAMARFGQDRVRHSRTFSSDSLVSLLPPQ